MKKILNYLLIASIFMVLASCSKFELEEPTFDFTLSATRVAVGEEVELWINGTAETFSVFTGDSGHEYINSHLFVNEGKDVDYEDVWLPSGNVEAVMIHLESAITSHNNSAATDQTRAIIDRDEIRRGLQEIADIRYTNSELLRVKIFDVLLELTGVKALSEEIVNLYADNDNLLLAPPGGYSSGFAIDRVEKYFSYSYSAPGTYIITVIGTNVGGKNHKGDGYKTNRTSSGDEYNYSRTVREMSITVE